MTGPSKCPSCGVEPLLTGLGDEGVCWDCEAKSWPVLRARYGVHCSCPYTFYNADPARLDAAAVAHASTHPGGYVQHGPLLGAVQDRQQR